MFYRSEDLWSMSKTLIDVKDVWKTELNLRLASLTNFGSSK